MSRYRDIVLDAGDPLPGLDFETVSHGRLALPEHFGDDWGALLLYRAGW